MIADRQAAPNVADEVWRDARAILDGESASLRALPDGAAAKRPGRADLGAPESAQVSGRVASKAQAGWILAIALSGLALGGVSAAIGWQTLRDPQMQTQMTHQIDELASHVNGLAQDVDAIAANQSHFAPRTEVEASQAALQTHLGRLSDQLDGLRTAVAAHDGGMELRLTRLEANEATVAAAPPPSPGHPTAGAAAERVSVPLGAFGANVQAVAKFRPHLRAAAWTGATPTKGRAARVYARWRRSN